MKSCNRKWAALVLAASLGMGMNLAHAGLFDDEEARKAILDLRERLDAVRLEGQQRAAEDSRRMGEENERLRRTVVELQALLEVSQSNSAKTKAQAEQLTVDMTELQRRLKSMALEVDERIRRFEPEKVSVDGRSFVADPAERRDFEFGVVAFQKGEFAAAQSTFAGFLRRYPASGYVPSSHFWLGNAQYANKDYKEALASYKAVLALAPDHARSADTLLGMAHCQIDLKDTRAARKLLDDLVRTYPDSEAAAAAKEKLARLR